MKGYKMKKNQYIKTGSDESYTYPYLIKPLIPFIEEFRTKIGIKNKKDLKIWCPFDLKDDLIINGVKYFKSYYVDILEKEGYTIISSHIFTGQDFFEYEPDDYHIIISNSPFKDKRLFFERAINLGKPFCILNTASWFNDTGVYNTFKNIHLQLLMPDKRAVFFNNEGNDIGTRPSFKAIYYCRDFLQNNDVKWFELTKEKY